MVSQVADGVHVRESEWVQSNTVVVRGPDGVVVVDPGIHAAELQGLANELSESGRRVVAGFSTHPHWDHLLWHAALGTPPRYATALAATTARQRLAGGIDARQFGIPDDVPLDLLGQLTALSADATEVPWAGPVIRIIEHQAHAPGHAALFIEESGVLVAGDMLSDVLIPMLDLRGPLDPVGDYLTALQLIEDVAGGADVVIPGHGSVGGAGELRTRIDRDRAYLAALREGRKPDDPRIGPSAKPGWEWVADVHTRQLDALAARAS